MDAGINPDCNHLVCDVAAITAGLTKHSPPPFDGGQKLYFGGIIMNINWKVRLKNPTFWAQIILSIISPILVGLGVQWQDMTTWAALWDALRNAVNNPVIVVSVIGSVWACITDPTTKGTADSALAMSYDKPKTKEKAE